MHSYRWYYHVLVLLGLSTITAAALTLQAGSFAKAKSISADYALAGPQISSISPTSVQRSGIIRISGSGLGTEATAVLRIDGKPSPFVAYWTDTNILAHVPENAATGSVLVEVTSFEGSASGSITVTLRQANERIRWRAEAAGDYVAGRMAVAAPGVPGSGTIYAATNAGFLYAWRSDGSLKWAVRGASGDDPVSVGPDGTIYAASAEPDSSGVVSAAVNAFNPDGSRKWTFVAPDSQSVRAGPSVGPDGKIYVIFRSMVDGNGNPIGPNLTALRPDGTLAWSVNRDFHKYGSMGKELTFGRQLPHVYFAFDVYPDPNPGFVNGGTFAYDFAGRLVWERAGGCCGVMAVPPDDGVRHYGTRLDALTGQLVYSFNFPPNGATPTGAPDAGPDNVHYIKGNSRLFAVNPNGTKKWHYDPVLPDGSFISTNSPVVNSTNSAILLGGGGSFGQQSVFLSVEPTTGRELWRQPLPYDPSFPPYGNIFFAGRATFSADGTTGYLAGDINGDQDFPFQQKYCYVYALNTGSDNIPINLPPQVAITSPTNGFQTAKNSPVNITADVQDDGEVAKVDFYYNVRGSTHFIGTDATAPFTSVFQAAQPDSYGIYAVATDAGGLTAQSAIVGIVLTNQSPAVSWVSPNNGAQFVSPPAIVLTVNANDPDGLITTVEFNSSRVGLIGQDSTADANGSYSVSFANPVVGTHDLYAWAVDDNGYRQSAVITVTVNAAPTPTPTPTPSPSPTPTPGVKPLQVKPRPKPPKSASGSQDVPSAGPTKQSGVGPRNYVILPGNPSRTATEGSSDTQNRKSRRRTKGRRVSPLVHKEQNERRM